MMDETEHEEKVDKDTLWVFKRCRNCQHPLVAHLGGLPNDSKVLVGQCNYVESGFCMCQEYMPPDNLDYIELLAKRRGLIKDEDVKGEGME